MFAAWVPSSSPRFQQTEVEGSFLFSPDENEIPVAQNRVNTLAAQIKRRLESQSEHGRRSGGLKMRLALNQDLRSGSYLANPKS
jgi:hypothetical protein